MVDENASDRSSRGEEAEEEGGSAEEEGAEGVEGREGRRRDVGSKTGWLRLRNDDAQSESEMAREVVIGYMERHPQVFAAYLTAVDDKATAYASLPTCFAPPQQHQAGDDLDARYLRCVTFRVCVMRCS